MPDLTEHTACTCQSNTSWETTVTGSKGDVYTVRYGRLYGRQADIQRCQYGYTCTCKGFAFRGTCGHVKQVEASDARCGWNSELDPGNGPEQDANGDPCCPECGAPVVSFRVAV